ncbi:MAG: HAD family hydrolase [Chloroflexi bacterium]|nr:HAD family hydrolase [Chloroflexota bacterium]
MLRAVVLDLDGTLYRQAPVRRAMLLRLGRVHALRPWRGAQTLRVLRAYRGAQEDLRVQSALPHPDLAAAQLRLASERSGTKLTAVTTIVQRWMEREPLDVLPQAIRPGVRDFLEACRAADIRLGLLSDYPAEAKLRALELDSFFDVVVTAQMTEVGVFKPNPRGLLLALARLGVEPREGLYIGDRPEVDAGAAEAAGVACRILTRRTSWLRTSRWQPVASFAELSELVAGRTQPCSTIPRPAVNPT